MLRTWVLYIGGRDYRCIQTCVQVPREWLEAWRARQVADGARIIAVYREKAA